jgi:hypothetical protein
LSFPNVLIKNYVELLINPHNDFVKIVAYENVYGKNRAEYGERKGQPVEAVMPILQYAANCLPQTAPTFPNRRLQ